MNTPSNILPASELKQWLETNKPFHLIDVMTPECYSSGHIAGSRQACVYETAFLNQVREIAPDSSAPIVVYGVQRHSLAAATAAQKLQEAGYADVRVLEGGLEGWAEAGYGKEGVAEPEDKTLSPDGEFTLDTTRSVVRWTGKNILNHHEGTAQFINGSILLSGGQLTSASFTVDMTSLACTDLADHDLRSKLIQHLVDNDFFAVKTWPSASFHATSARPIEAVADGSPNHELTGDFTLRGVTQEITFPIVVGLADDNTLGAQAEIDIDRTRWGANYGSGKLFEFVGKHLVSDWVHLHIKIVATRKP